MACVAACVPTNRRSEQLTSCHSHLRCAPREVLESIHPPRTGGFMHLRHATGVLLILIASAVSCMGQGRPGQIRVTYGIAGTVRDDSDQHTMESVRVDLKQATGTPLNSTFTRGSGEFEFSG